MVIGLGRFGTAVARALVRLGHEVLAVDASQELVEELADELPNLLRADTTDADVLKQLDVTGFDHVVVSIGQNLEASVLTVLNLSQMGVRDIWVKAATAQHGRIVERLGAHHVVFPEADMGSRVAHLVTGKMMDFIEFTDGFALAKTRAPREMHGRTLAESNIRPRFEVTIVGIKRAHQDFIYAVPESRVEPGDLLIVAGLTPKVERFAGET
ncbi:TrkA family potassium uptake protein [Ottowia testudinis]|uniref:TrkA family potassium uptake protein n=2 Tax=Ottowia testudinis TaxID=2816950 RepID=A0A975H4U2_9BURK|nr:TrkA family potassium uptake protein [Ottowia testudinis]